MTHRHELVPGQSVPLFELKPPVFEGVDYAIKRAFDFAVPSFSLLVLSPAFLAIVARDQAHLEGARLLSAAAGPESAAQPFDCLKFRTMQTDAEQRQEELEGLNEADGALFKIRRDPRVTTVGAPPAPLQPRRAAAARQRPARRDVAGRAAAAADARLRPARGLAPQALPGAAGHHGAVAGLRPLRSSTSTSWCGSTSSTWSAGASSSISRS